MRQPQIIGKIDGTLWNVTDKFRAGEAENVVRYDNTAKKSSYFCSKMSNGTCNVRKSDI